MHCECMKDREKNSITQDWVACERAYVVFSKNSYLPYNTTAKSY